MVSQEEFAELYDKMVLASRNYPKTREDYLEFLEDCTTGKFPEHKCTQAWIAHHGVGFDSETVAGKLFDRFNTGDSGNRRLMKAVLKNMAEINSVTVKHDKKATDIWNKGREGVAEGKFQPHHPEPVEERIQPHQPKFNGVSECMKYYVGLPKGQKLEPRDAMTFCQDLLKPSSQIPTPESADTRERPTQTIITPSLWNKQDNYKRIRKILKADENYISQRCFVWWNDL